ncbi:MAG: response regulator [Anaerolineae bacterium]|nr:response regulator [Anaerolineae bacterium]
MASTRKRSSAGRRPPAASTPLAQKTEQAAPTPTTPPASVRPTPAGAPTGPTPSPSVSAPAPAAVPPAPAAPTSPLPSPPSIKGGDKIRILIVDDNPDTRENVSRLLYFEDDMDVIGQAVNGRHGIEMAINLKPHIVLMDINMPDMDGITATEKMSVDAPYSQVIIMSVQAEQHYMKRAMAAGARDFQPKPFTADELINCIHRVYQIGVPIYQKIEAVERVQATMAPQQKVKASLEDTDTPVIVVYSAKGGAGTSAIAANLAAALQQIQGDIVLMDADLQFGDISVNLNLRPTRTISDLVHDDALDTELVPEVVLAHDSGLKVLLAPPQPQLADAIMPPMAREVIKALKGQFKGVVIDTSSQLNDLTLSVLESADYILVVTAPELPAIKSAKLFLELAGQLEFSPEQLGVVVNRTQQPGGVRTEQIAKVLKLQHIYTIPYDPRIYMATYKGALVNQQDVGAPSAQAIARLAHELWQKLAHVEEKMMPVEEVA